MLVTPLVCTCAGFTPGGSLRKKRPSLSRPVPWCDVLGALEARRPLDFASLVLWGVASRPDAGPGGRLATRHGKTFLVSTIPSSYRVVCAKQCCSAPISAVVPPMSLVWQWHANSPSSVATRVQCKQSRVWRKFAAPVSVTEPQCVPISCALRAGLLGAGALERGW